MFWLYSRKHGDLERDYNDFQLSPTYYSVYHNPKRKATFGKVPARIRRMELTTVSGERVAITGAKLKGDWARKVRAGAVQRIDALLD